MHHRGGQQRAGQCPPKINKNCLLVYIYCQAGPLWIERSEQLGGTVQTAVLREKHERNKVNADINILHKLRQGLVVTKVYFR